MLAISSSPRVKPRPTPSCRKRQAGWKSYEEHVDGQRSRCRRGVLNMALSLTWLPRVLLDAGLKVAEQPGWQNRGRSDVGAVKGVICHHTAGPLGGNMPSLGIVTNGRRDLPRQLAQLGLGRDGTL